MSPKTKYLEWSSKKDEILINFVKNHECLYNVQCRDFRKVELKKSLWYEIGGILKKTDVDCSRRWSYVRDYYIKRRGKAAIGSCGEAAKKRSEQLSFLDDLPSRKKGTITNDHVNNSTYYSNRKDYSTEENVTEVVQNEEIWKVEDTTDNISRTDTEASDVVEAPPQLKRKCLSSKSNNFEERIYSKKIAERQQHIEIQDETDLFFAAIAKIVKKLPERNRAEIRLNIANLVGNAEVKYLSRRRSDRRPISSFTKHTANASFEEYLSEEDYSSLEPSTVNGILPDNENKRNLKHFKISHT